MLVGGAHRLSGQDRALASCGTWRGDGARVVGLTLCLVVAAASCQRSNPAFRPGAGPEADAGHQDTAPDTAADRPDPVDADGPHDTGVDDAGGDAVSPCSESCSAGSVCCRTPTSEGPRCVPAGAGCLCDDDPDKCGAGLMCCSKGPGKPPVCQTGPLGCLCEGPAAIECKVGSVCCAHPGAGAATCQTSVAECLCNDEPLLCAKQGFACCSTSGGGDKICKTACGG